jgi:predicted porin
MKKTLLAVALAAALPSVAIAQVTLGGTINTGLIDTGADGAKVNVTRFGGGANAINLTATEDLGGGLRGGFTGQIRFFPQTGDMASSPGDFATTDRSLLHAANVFIGGNFGTVRVGKIAEASNCAFDPWGCTSIFIGAGNATAALVAAQTSANSVSYDSPTIAGFSLGYQTTVERVGGDRTIARLTYSAGPFMAQVLQADKARADAAVGAGTALQANPDVKQLGLSASYDFGMAKLMYNRVHGDNTAGVRVNEIDALGAVIPVGPVAVWAGYSRDSKAPANADTLWALGVNYALGKRTSVGADVFDRESPTGSTGYALRVRHTF